MKVSRLLKGQVASLFNAIRAEVSAVRSAFIDACQTLRHDRSRGVSFEPKATTLNAFFKPAPICAVD